MVFLEFRVCVGIDGDEAAARDMANEIAETIAREVVENYGEYGWAARDDALVDTCEVEKVEGERPAGGGAAGGAATKCPYCGIPMARKLSGEFCMNDDCPGFPKGASDE